jgi:hypothetical protein
MSDCPLGNDAELPPTSTTIITQSTTNVKRLSMYAGAKLLICKQCLLCSAMLFGVEQLGVAVSP